MGLSDKEKIQSLQNQLTSIRQQIVNLTNTQKVVDRQIYSPAGSLFYVINPDGTTSILLTPPTN